MTTATTSAHDGNCLLITGASSGLGREMALRLSSGHRLILGGRDPDRLQKTLGDCEGANRHLVWRHDLTDVENLATRLGEFLVLHDIRVSGFIHCAAVLNILPLRSLTVAMIRDAFNANVLSAMEILRTITKRKINRQQLRAVVFVSSIASQFGAKGFSAYSASKGALDALMKSLAVELAPDVRVNSVLPGALRTPMTEVMFGDPELARKLEADYPLGIGLPADVIDAVEFLLSDKARWITGQQLVIDGGRTTNITA